MTNWKDKFSSENRYFETANGILYKGDCLEILKEFPNEIIDCLVTSPPYWALRDYGIEGQLGLEKTFQEYLEKLWCIYDEIYRILKSTGTCWVNLGDTYMNNSSYCYKGRRGFIPKEGMIYKKDKIVKQKSLCMIPERFSIGMIERGWILRNEIIWYKPNCMPESVKDRFTVDFEKIFFFVKQRKYYFEQQFELHRSSPHGGQIGRRTSDKYIQYDIGDVNRFYKIQGRNKRTVWFINTKPFKEAHFAVFPPEIPQNCIKAGCHKDGIVVDIFSGSGTTLVAAEKLNRKWIGIEINQKYCEITKQRLLKEIEHPKLF